VYGRIDEVGVVMLQGRVHYYEGHSPETIVFGTRLLSQLGIRTLIVTNAAGGISPSFAPGDLMLISGHLRPLAAVELNLGVLMKESLQQSDIQQRLDSFLWNSQLRRVAQSAPTDLRIHEGTYAMMTGPAYETPAEIRMLRHLGADAVGMSTVPEALFAASQEIAVLGISCITNVAAGLSEKALDHDDVTATASSIEPRFVDWLWQILQRLPV
jgi:purine-nucleoside phosphorylase